MTRALPRTGFNRDLLALLGNTPVARLDGYWAKLECISVGGMKARAAMSMLLGARARGELRPGQSVVESTSGTMGIGLAFAGHVLGHPVVLVADRELERGVRTLLRAYGARVEIVDTPDPVGGWQQARRDRVELLRGTAYWPDQYHNPDNPAGYVGMARELVDQVEHADVVVCSVGTGGHSAGLAAELRRWWPQVRFVGVDTVGSTIFGQPARPRLARGLGSSIFPDNVAYDCFSEVHWVGAAEAAQTCRRLAREYFVSGGWSTGCVARVAAWVARVEPGSRVAAIFPDGPHRYLDTIFDDDYCAAHGLLGSVADHPVEIADPAVEISGWARCTTAVRPR